MDLFLRDSLLEISLLNFFAGDISWRLFVRIFFSNIFWYRFLCTDSGTNISSDFVA